MNLRLAAGLLIVAGVIGACVIAEPPTDLPTLPVLPPTIVRTSTFPPPTAVLTRWPQTFYVPVRVSDPRLAVTATYFVDYNPFNGGGYDNSRTDTPGAGATATVRTLEIQITEPSANRCHVVEVLVALEFNSLEDGKNAHTPREPGGDSVTWFYSPSGDLAGCPVLDAGIVPDAQALDADGATP